MILVLGLGLGLGCFSRIDANSDLNIRASGVMEEVDYADVRRVLNDSTEGAEIMSSCRVFHSLRVLTKNEFLYTGVVA